MKKIAILLFFYAVQALADNTKPTCPDWRSFDIVVKNNTQSDCVVIQQTLRRGYLEETLHPLSLKLNEEKKVFKIRDFAFQGSDMVLTYQCGVDKFATIESERDIWAANNKYVKGWIWSIAGMDASYTAEYGDCEENQPAKIVWTLH